MTAESNTSSYKFLGKRGGKIPSKQTKSKPQRPEILKQLTLSSFPMRIEEIQLYILICRSPYRFIFQTV